MDLYEALNKLNKELYLYHATDRKNLEDILEKGLLINPPYHNWDGIDCVGKVFLALDASVAEDYALTSDNPPDEVVILKVKLDSLNPSSFGYDWNNRCEYHTDINSCVYYSDITGNLLSVCDASSEPSQEFDDFEGTELYDKLFDVFWEECETNLERDD